MTLRFDCDDVLAVFDALVDGTATAGARSAARSHAGTCPDCRALLAALDGGPATAEDSGVDVVAGVLERTAADPCRRALDLVASAAVASADRMLLDGHLERCPPCAAVATALAALERDLPALAVPEAAPDLLPAVLRRTLPLPVRLARAWRPLAAVARSAACRPRFALEASYAALVALVLAFGVPTFSVPAEVPGAAPAEMRAGAAAAGDWIAAGASRAASAGGTFARDFGGLLGAGLRPDPRPDRASEDARVPGDDHERP